MAVRVCRPCGILLKDTTRKPDGTSHRGPLHQMEGCHTNPIWNSCNSSTSARRESVRIPGCAGTTTRRSRSTVESKLMKELCAIWGIHKTRTIPYHPEENGMVEKEATKILAMHSEANCLVQMKSGICCCLTSCVASEPRHITLLVKLQTT